MTTIEAFGHAQSTWLSEYLDLAGCRKSIFRQSINNRFHLKNAKTSHLPLVLAL